MSRDRVDPAEVDDDELCGHSAVLTYTRRPRDLFRKRFWVRCWDCDLADGPYVHDYAARQGLRLHQRRETL